ncbi:MAG TPA: rhodanese-like domain-containing protein [Thermoanaerobaculia bacterium]|jgi:3-mercaptopyruvate sulfurtransferase SseA|nr:rhodanese-like domain-containing protein [Thermoanaerobaculia bacterium]
MIKYLVPLAVPLVISLAMPGAQAASQTPPTPPPAAAPADPLAEAPRISAADAKKALDAGQAVLVDVRGLDAWQDEHAKGAVSIPVNELYTRLGELPKDKQVIAYCT